MLNNCTVQIVDLYKNMNRPDGTAIMDTNNFSSNNRNKFHRAEDVKKVYP